MADVSSIDEMTKLVVMDRLSRCVLRLSDRGLFFRGYHFRAAPMYGFIKVVWCTETVIYGVCMLHDKYHLRFCFSMGALRRKNMKWFGSVAVSFID